MTKKQTDQVMAGLFGLLVVSSVATLWLYWRYQQAAAVVETLLAKGLQIQNGLVVAPAVQEQVVADARLRTFLVMSILTGICAVLLVALVLWRRNQRLRGAKAGASAGRIRPNEVVNG